MIGVLHRLQHAEMALCSRVNHVGDLNSDVTMNGRSVADAPQKESAINVFIIQLR